MNYSLADKLRTFGFNEILMFIYEIKKREADLYIFMMNRDLITIDEIAEKLGRERSGINRIVSNLTKAGLLKRHFRIRKCGGSAYAYEATSLEDVRETVLFTLSDFQRHAKLVLDKL